MDDDNIITNEDEEEKRRRLVEAMQQPFNCGVFSTAPDFMTTCWPRVEKAVFIILTQKPGEFIPLSYEELYSLIYKGVVNYHSAEMFEKLEVIVRKHLRRKFVNQLNSSMKDYLERFSFLLAQYFQAVNSIVAIFHYMDRVYLTRKKQMDFPLHLRNLLTDILRNHGAVFERLSHATSQAFAASPDIMMQVVKGLYSLDQTFAQRCPEVFQRFIPNLIVTCNVDDLPRLIEESRQMQDELILKHGFERTSRLNKRTVESVSEPAQNPVSMKRSHDD